MCLRFNPRLLCGLFLLVFPAECETHQDSNDDRGERENHTNAVAEIASDEIGRCPEKHDPHGTWTGTRGRGTTNYTLACDFGYVVGDEKVINLTCNDEGQWSSDPWCENEDDCEKLKYGCGPGGLCVDHVGRSECLCEHGAWMRYRGGEQYCDMRGEHCGGKGCGAHGVCIKLDDYQGSFDSGASAFRCSCEAGYEDNGNSCKAKDCGERADANGVWSGSTKYGGEYTLQCKHGTTVWGGQQQAVTVSCPKYGRWRNEFKCMDPAQEAKDALFGSFRFVQNVLFSVLCICTAALAAGLTFGLVSLESMEMEIKLAEKADDCPPEEKHKLEQQQANAVRLKEIKKDPHLLLVTLLLLNALANEALPLFLDELMPPVMAVLFSVSLVLMCAEVLPSALFSGPSRFALAASCIPLVQFLMKLFYIVANPLARLLDRIVDGEEEEHFSRCMLRAVLRLHTGDSSEPQATDTHHGKQEQRPLEPMERDLIMSVLDLGEKKVYDSVGFRPIASSKRLSCAKSFMAAKVNAKVKDVLDHAKESPLEAVVIFGQSDFKDVTWPIDVNHNTIKAILRIAELDVRRGETLQDLDLPNIITTVQSDDLVTDVLHKLSIEQGDMRGIAVVLDKGEDFLGLLDGEDALEEIIPCSAATTTISPQHRPHRLTLAQELAEADDSHDISSIYGASSISPRTLRYPKIWHSQGSADSSANTTAAIQDTTTISLPKPEMPIPRNRGVLEPLVEEGVQE